MAKKQPWVVGQTIVVTVECPNGHQGILEEPSLSFMGGCSGNHYEGNYCYCDSPYLEVDWLCMECSKKGTPYCASLSIT
jgi:hypothetical protein